MPQETPEKVLERWRRETRAVLRDAERDVVEEVAQHVTDRWLHARSRGAHPGEADARARAELASWTSGPRPGRRPRVDLRGAWMGLGADVRYAVRALRARPLFAAGAVLLSAIGVAAMAAAVAIVYGILWRPLPYPDPDRLAVLWQVRRGEQTQISYPDFRDVSAASVFDGAAAIGGGRGSLRVGDRIERINVLDMEPAGYALLGATPALGRLLGASDQGTPNVLISHRLWTTHLRSDPRVIGRALWISGRTYTVVGVLRPGFDFELPVPPSFRLENNDVWRALDTSSSSAADRDFWTYEALVRLAPGRTLAEAQAAADATAARLAAAYPSTNTGRTFRVALLEDEVVAAVRRPLVFVLLAAVVTLLVALANLVILGLVRGLEREAEFSIRAALGAGMFRLRRQLFTENLLIAACAALCGIALARPLVAALVQSEAAGLPRAGAIRFDAPVWLTMAAITLLAAFALNGGPMPIRSSTLRTGSRTAGSAVRRTRRAMVAAEVALALVLSTGGAALGLSLVRLLAVDPGFDPGGAAAARVSAYPARYPVSEDVVRFVDEVLERVRRTPGVASAGAGSSLPLSGQNSGASVIAEGHAGASGVRPTAGWQHVTRGYFDAAGMRILRGRDFSEADRRRERHVTIVNEALARALFAGEDPIGRRIGIGGDEAGGDWHEVIGVVADVRHQALDAGAAPRVYDLFGQHWGRTLFVVARTISGDASPLVGVIRRTVGAVDPEAPVFEGATMQSLVERSAAAHRLASAIAAMLAAAGVLLALIGVYAVAAASVAERTREIGVRAALGAAPSDLFRLIARDGASAVIPGCLAGLGVSVVAVLVLQSQLFGIRSADLFWLVPGVSAAVLCAAVAAGMPPARRAAAADPLEAMRVE